MSKKASKTKSNEVVKPEIKEKNLGGRPTKYTKGLAERFCKAFISFNNVQDCCDSSDEFPNSASTIHYWLVEHAEFLEMYKRANKARAFKFVDDAVKFADDDSKDLIINPITKETKSNASAVTRSALKSNVRLALAKRMNYEIFGDDDPKKNNVVDALQTVSKFMKELPN